MRPFVDIAAPQETKQAFSLLAKAVRDRTWQKNIEECIKIAEAVIDINSSNYTAWWLRRRCFENATDEVLKEELTNFTRLRVEAAPKSYQAWYHREWLVKHIKKIETDLLQGEMHDLGIHLDDDGKNHCAWQYRQMLVTHLKLPTEPEYEFVENMILGDCRNNSAWNYREWLCSLASPAMQDAIRKREMKYVSTWIRRTPTNESLFNYLRSFYKDPKGKQPENLPSIGDLHPSAKTLLLEMAEMDERWPTSPLVLETKYAILLATGMDEEAKAILSALSNQSDPIHRGYFDWLRL